MKLVKNFVLAVLLASVLAVSVPAGEVDGPGYAGPTPTPTPARYNSDEETGKSDVTVISAETSDYLFFEALAALLSVY